MEIGDKSINIIQKKDCFGCRSCEQICPKQCISMQEDREGFIFPQIDKNVCVNCGLCLSNCPVKASCKENNHKQKFYAIQLKNEVALSHSSSGGAAFGFADFVLDNKGIVFGCVYDEKLNAKMASITTKDNLLKTQGSKYVFSDTQNTFSEAKKILEETEAPLLYIGRPCQIVGLKSFLGKNYKNLITVDFVCHGVPSQKFFSKYLQWLGDKTGGEIIYYGFRDKDVAGWTCGGKTKTKTKTKTIDASCDPYYASFLRGENYRECCYQCPYSSLNRPGDVTIGDFWGVEKFYPEVPYKKGISICILNSEKGKEIFEKLQDRFYFFEIQEKEACAENGNLVHPSERPMLRDAFYDGIDGDIDELLKKIRTRSYFVAFVFRLVKKIVPNRLLKKAKKILHGN